MARVPMPGRLSERHAVKVVLRRAKLHTVCEEARCPNMGDCFGRHTATFLVLGDTCSRNCGFCSIGHGRPAPPDADEPRRVAEAVGQLGIRHVVITSVTRDDLPDGGAGHFVGCLHEIRARNPGVTVELLVPDFAGQRSALETVLAEKPDVLNHNLETVPRLYRRVRPQADFRRSLQLLARAREAGGEVVVKSGLMVGLGETRQEVEEVLRDLARAGCQVVTIGQYLQPTRQSLPVERLVEEEEYRHYRRLGTELGLVVVAGRLVRSSYRARETLAGLRHGWTGRGKKCNI